MFYELVLVAVLIGVSDGKIIVDDFKTMESWAVLDHFCFLPVLPGGEVDEDGKSADAGLFSYEVTMRGRQALLRVAMAPTLVGALGGPV